MSATVYLTAYLEKCPFPKRGGGLKKYEEAENFNMKIADLCDNLRLNAMFVQSKAKAIEKASMKGETFEWKQKLKIRSPEK